MMRWSLGFVLVGLLVSTAIGRADAPPPAPELPADVDLVPRDVFMIFAMRPADLASNVIDAKLLKQLDKLFQSPVQQNKKELPLEPGDIERVIAAIDQFNPLNANNQQPGAAVVVLAKKALDPKKILDGILPDAKKDKIGDKNYFLAGNNALFFHGERIFCFGDQKTITRWLKLSEAGRRTGALSGALKLAVDQDLVMAMNPQSLAQLLPLVGGQVPPEFQPLMHLVKCKTSVLSVSVRDELEIDLIVTLGDQATRDAAAKDGRAGLNKLAELIGPLQKTLPDEGLPKTAKLLEAAQAALKKAPVRQEGLRVHIPVYVQADKKTIQAAVEELIRKIPGAGFDAVPADPQQKN
ncbi:MAG: hypothetical protein AB7K24_09480 [Gemmataceae bacterium]